MKANYFIKTVIQTRNMMSL
jgi:hypothetical protein